MARGEKTDGEVSKSKAVRTALAELGDDANLSAIHSFVNERFGMTIDRNIISSLKSTALRKAAGESGRLRTSAITLDDIRAVRGLIDRFGAHRLRELVAAMYDADEPADEVVPDAESDESE